MPQALAETRRWAAPGSKSAALFAQAQGVMPGGNTRTTVYMAPHPPYAASGEGCWITDVEGDRRLDCLNNYTALIHGHAHPAIVEAATRRLALGSSFPLPTPEEVELAALLCERLPSAERVRFTNSGSEAVMMAIKGARAFTGRPEDRQVRGRLPRLLRLRGGEPRLRPEQLGQPGRAGQHRLLARRAAGGARGRGGAAVQPRGAGGRAHRARGQAPRGRAGGPDPEPRRADPGARATSCARCAR